MPLSNRGSTQIIDAESAGSPIRKRAMTLILTHLSKFGIIHASDSNLTSDADAPEGQGQKVFKVPFLNAGLSIAGAYSVAGKPMDVWMTDFISSQASDGVGSISNFAHGLKNRRKRASDKALAFTRVCRLGNIFKIIYRDVDEVLLR